MVDASNNPLLARRNPSIAVDAAEHENQDRPRETEPRPHGLPQRTAALSLQPHGAEPAELETSETEEHREPAAAGEAELGRVDRQAAPRPQQHRADGADDLPGQRLPPSSAPSFDRAPQAQPLKSHVADKPVSFVQSGSETRARSVVNIEILQQAVTG